MHNAIRTGGGEMMCIAEPYLLWDLFCSSSGVVILVLFSLYVSSFLCSFSSCSIFIIFFFSLLFSDGLLYVSINSLISCFPYVPLAVFFLRYIFVLALVCLYLLLLRCIYYCFVVSLPTCSSYVLLSCLFFVLFPYGSRLTMPSCEGQIYPTIVTLSLPKKGSHTVSNLFLPETWVRF